MTSFDETVQQMATILSQADGTTVVFGVTDDRVLRDHAVDALRACLAPDLRVRDLRYDPEHLSLLESALDAGTNDGRAVISLAGLEALPRDKRTEAIQLLNLQRNRFGRTGIPVVLWVDQATLADISTKAADFYSWRSAAFFLEPPESWDALASARRGYLEAVLADTEYVNLQGLAPMRGGQIVQMRMDDIFIPLCAEEETRGPAIDDPFWKTYLRNVSEHLLIEDASARPAYADTAALFSLRVPADESAHSTSAETGPPDTPGLGGPVFQVLAEGSGPVTLITREVRARLERLAATQSFEAQGGTTKRRVEIPELLQERRAVILGDPGAGKTTLLRYAAREVVRSQTDRGASEVVRQTPALAACFPVYIRIGEYAQHLRQDPDTTLDAFAPQSCRVHDLPLTDNLLDDAMAKGEVLWLLDGLDEVIDADQCREVAQRVEQFAASHPECGVLVTSRLVGYREAQLGGRFSQFTIKPFDDPEIKRFAHNWYSALGMPDGERAFVDALGEPAIRRLATNPLLITVIALIHWRGTKLPSHRVDLYRSAAETLVNQWMSQRRVTPEGWDARETLQVLLPAVAWHLHQSSPTGLIGEEELAGVLAGTLQEQDRQLSPDEAHARASQFRRNVSEFSGIFLERGVDPEGRGIYGFLHLTFEEYFAGLRLADKWEREGMSALTQLLHDPRWTEVILLAAGHLGTSSQHRATLFVRTILEAHSEYEEILHRDLLLAARCLADDVRVDAELRRYIVSCLIDLYFAWESPNALKGDIRTAFARLDSLPAGREVASALTEQLDSGDELRGSLAAHALSEMDSAVATPHVLRSLVKLVSASSVTLQAFAAVALGKLANAALTTEVISALLKLLSDPENEVRNWAAAALAQIGEAAAAPNVLKALLGLLSDPETKVRRSAAIAVGRIEAGRGSPEALRAILNSLSDTQAGVRSSAAIALGEIGPAAASQQALPKLLKILDDPHGEVRSSAAGALGRIGRVTGHKEIVAPLLNLLSDPEPTVVATAAKALGGIGQEAPEVFSALLNLLSDPGDSVRAGVATALGNLGPASASPGSLSALFRLLSDPEGNVRASAATAIGNMADAVVRPEVVAALLTLLGDPEPRVRAHAAEALGRVGQASANGEVPSPLLGLLADPEGDVRAQAALAVARLGGATVTAEVLSSLLKLQLDPDWNVRLLAEEAVDIASRGVPSGDRAEVLKLFLWLYPMQMWEFRNVGYIGLRNVLGTGAA